MKNNIIRRRHKTKFDYVSRFLGAFSVILVIFTISFLAPSLNNIVLSNVNHDLNREYNKLKDTIKNTNKD